MGQASQQQHWWIDPEPSSGSPNPWPGKRTTTENFAQGYTATAADTLFQNYAVVCRTFGRNSRFYHHSSQSQQKTVSIDKAVVQAMQGGRRIV